MTKEKFISCARVLVAYTIGFGLGFYSAVKYIEPRIEDE